jgi:hypothetical protein
MSDAEIARDARGWFLPGKSANPGGMSRGVGEVKRLAQQHGPAMLQALVEIVGDKSAPHAARVAAAREVLDRAYGRPEVNVDMRLHMQKLEILLQGQTAAMSDADLAAFADRWDELMQSNVIEHVVDDPPIDAT